MIRRWLPGGPRSAGSGKGEKQRENHPGTSVASHHTRPVSDAHERAGARTDRHSWRETASGNLRIIENLEQRLGGANLPQGLAAKHSALRYAIFVYANSVD